MHGMAGPEIICWLTFLHTGLGIYAKPELLLLHQYGFLGPCHFLLKNQATRKLNLAGLNRISGAQNSRGLCSLIAFTPWIQCYQWNILSVHYLWLHKAQLQLNIFHTSTHWLWPSTVLIFMPPMFSSWVSNVLLSTGLPSPCLGLDRLRAGYWHSIHIEEVLFT